MRREPPPHPTRAQGRRPLLAGRAQHKHGCPPQPFSITRRRKGYGTRRRESKKPDECSQWIPHMHSFRTGGALGTDGRARVHGVCRATGQARVTDGPSSEPTACPRRVRFLTSHHNGIVSETEEKGTSGCLWASVPSSGPESWPRCRRAPKDPHSPAPHPELNYIHKDPISKQGHVQRL